MSIGLITALSIIGFIILCVIIIAIVKKHNKDKDKHKLNDVSSKNEFLDSSPTPNSVDNLSQPDSPIQFASDKNFKKA